MDDEHKKDLYCTVFVIEYEACRECMGYADAVKQAEAAACYAIRKYEHSFPY